jgi:hypothetical protein
MVKKKKTTFDKVRLALRLIGGSLGAFPVVAYLIFAFYFDKVRSRFDLVTSEVSVIEGPAFEMSKVWLVLANWGWTYLLPISLLIAAWDIGVSLYRQIRDS